MDFKDKYQYSSVGRPISISSLLRSALPGRPGRFTLSLFWILIAGAALLPQAHAASIPYPLNLFALVNSNSDGTAIWPDGGGSVILTGGNNGSGLTGTTDLVAMAIGAVTIEFQYTYTSLDIPEFDWAGYLIGNQFTLLANTNGQFGTASFPVLAGDTFGFRVATADNSGEPGVFAISGFSTGTSSVPEPATRSVVLATALAMAVAFGRRRYVHPSTEKN